MKPKRLAAVAIGVAVALGIFAWGALPPPFQPDSRAWESTAHARRPNAMRSRENGFLLKGGVGVDGCTDRWCDEMYPLLYLRVGAYYQFLKYMAAGVHLAFTFAHPEKNNEDAARVHLDTFWSLVVGPEFRGILPIKKLDLWAGIMVGYSRWAGVGEQYQPGPDRIVNWEGWMHGFVLGWGWGLDYYLHPNMAVGAEIYFYKAWYDDVCVEVMGSTDCSDLSNWDRYDIGLWWSVGFVFTGWFGI